MSMPGLVLIAANLTWTWIILRKTRRTVREQDRTITNLLVLLGKHGVLLSRCDCHEVLIGNQQELVLLDGWHGPTACVRP
jgi:hypothetical protein